MSSTFFLAITNVLVITLRKTFETKFISANKVVDVFIVFYAFLTKKNFTNSFYNVYHVRHRKSMRDRLIENQASYNDEDAKYK